MIILNFAHPLTPAQLDRVTALTRQDVERVIDVQTHVELQQPLAPQIVVLADRCGLASAEWQSLAILVNPPALNFVAVALLAEIHGRCGYFPAHLCLRTVEGAVPPRYEVAELLDLQQVRQMARRIRAE